MKKIISGILAIFIWSMSATILAKVEDTDPFLISWIIYISGTIIFLLSNKYREELKRIKEIPLKYIFWGIFGIGIHDLMWILSIQNTSPEEASMIIYQWPILIVIFTIILKKEKFNGKILTSLILSSFGIMALFINKTEITFNNGYLFAIISALTWAIFSAKISIDKKMSKYSNLIIMLNFLIFGSLNFILWILFGEKVETKTIDMSIIITNGIMSALSNFLWFYSMKSKKSNLIVLLSLFTPALSILWLILFGFTEFKIEVIVSVLLILSGIIISNFKTK